MKKNDKVKKKKLKDEDLDLLDDLEDLPNSKDTSNEETYEEIQERKKIRRNLDDVVIKHTHDSALAKILRSRKVSPLDIMHGSKSFVLDDLVQPINAQAFGKVKRINVVKQINWYEKSYKRVLSQNWLAAGIGGFPSDQRAKQLALHLFIKAIKEHQERDPRKNQNRSLPYWHSVYGGFEDELRDLSSNFPSFIVISNITSDSSKPKLEKVRDILVKYNNMGIPVVVVCAGMDPYTLFATKLYYPMRWGIYLGNTIVEL